MKEPCDCCKDIRDAEEIFGDGESTAFEQIKTGLEEALEHVRGLYPHSIAEQITSVQPMPSDVLSSLIKYAKTDAELIEAGYRPVSEIGLLWVKDTPNDNDVGETATDQSST